MSDTLSSVSQNITSQDDASEESKDKNQQTFLELQKLLSSYKTSCMQKHSTKKYRTLDEFTHFKPVKKNSVFGNLMNKIDMAEERSPTRQLVSQFEGHYYHIALRHGEYHAQKEKAMAEIYKFFLGRAPDIDIIKMGETFLIASRTIKNFTHDFSDFIILEDGNLKSKKTNTVFKVQGLGAIAAIDYFFGSNDSHLENFGIQQNNDEVLAYRIDSADSLDIELLEIPITSEKMASLPVVKRGIKHTMENAQEKLEETESDSDAYIYCLSLPKEIIQSKSFQEEMVNMFKKIATTDFAIIKQMLQNSINCSPVDETYWNLNWMLNAVIKGPQLLHQESENSLDECEAFINQIKLQFKIFLESIVKLTEQGFDYVLGLLENRHKQLKMILGVDTKMTSDQVQPSVDPVVFSDLKNKPTSEVTVLQASIPTCGLSTHKSNA